jgi:hypothetical protein
MPARTYYKSGDHNIECAECSFEFKRSQLRRRYDGALVCQADWEPRPKQEMKERKHKGTISAKDINKASKTAMEDDYDADDHTINASSIPAYSD